MYSRVDVFTWVFLVLFNKWFVFKKSAACFLMQVEMEVNGVLVDVRMMLDETGSAFFSKLKVQVC